MTAFHPGVREHFPAASDHAFTEGQIFPESLHFLERRFAFLFPNPPDQVNGRQTAPEPAPGNRDQSCWVIEIIPRACVHRSVLFFLPIQFRIDHGFDRCLPCKVQARHHVNVRVVVQVIRQLHQRVPGDVHVRIKPHDPVKPRFNGVPGNGVPGETDQRIDNHSEGRVFRFLQRDQALHELGVNHVKARNSNQCFHSSILL